MTARTESPYLTTREVAEIIRMTPTYVMRQCAVGAIKATKLGHEYRIHRDEVDRFMARGSEVPTDRPGRSERRRAR